MTKPVFGGSDQVRNKSVGMSNRARSDIRAFASGIRIHPDVRIVCQTIFESFMSEHIVAPMLKLY